MVVGAPSDGRAAGRVVIWFDLVDVYMDRARARAYESRLRGPRRDSVSRFALIGEGAV